MKKILWLALLCASIGCTERRECYNEAFQLPDGRTGVSHVCR